MRAIPCEQQNISSFAAAQFGISIAGEHQYVEGEGAGSVSAVVLRFTGTNTTFLSACQVLTPHQIIFGWQEY